MNERVEGPAINLGRYEQLMDVIRNRLTSRQFDPKIAIPREHIEMVLEAARHAPSGANAQPCHYIAVTDPQGLKPDDIPRLKAFFKARSRETSPP